MMDDHPKYSKQFWWANVRMPFLNTFFFFRFIHQLKPDAEPFFSLGLRAFSLKGEKPAK
jgi:hypothetical protein